jgi:hypothetical protein
VTKNAETKSFTFPLEVVDDWPPVAAEGLVFEPFLRGWRLVVPPLFVKKLSVGDVVRIHQSKGIVRDWNHLSKSKSTTIWLLLKTDGAEKIATLVLARLDKMGCQTVLARTLSSASVSVPDTVPIASVDKIIARVDPTDIAVAYPSFRHDDV